MGYGLTLEKILKDSTAMHELKLITLVEFGLVFSIIFLCYLNLKKKNAFIRLWWVTLGRLPDIYPAALLLPALNRTVGGENKMKNLLG